MSHHQPGDQGGPGGAEDRRGFISKASSVAMAAGLVGGYGTLGAYAGRYLYPAKPTPKGFVYAADISTMKRGEAFQFTTPSGDKVLIARHGDGNTAKDFIALSGTCPHLGCKVLWEPHNKRFFCPCHNGVFDPQGKPLEGPPAAANTPLARFNLDLPEGSNLLFIEVELQSLTSVADASQPNAEQLS